MTLRHVVTWKLAETDESARAEIARTVREKLLSLPPQIEEILAFEVGINAAGPENNFDVVLIADYADEAALNRYVQHPAHQEVVVYVRSVTAGRSAVDFFVD